MYASTDECNVIQPVKQIKMRQNRKDSKDRVTAVMLKLTRHDPNIDYLRLVKGFGHGKQV